MARSNIKYEYIRRGEGRKLRALKMKLAQASRELSVVRMREGRTKAQCLYALRNPR